MNGIQYVKAIGRCYGKRLTTDEAEYVLWNKTGFPEFWHTDNPRQELRHQAAEYLRGVRRCDRCGDVLDPLAFDCWPDLCKPCSDWMEA